MQCLLWPGREPVNTAIIDQAREVTTSCPEGLPHRRHGQHDVKVVCALVNKVLPNRLPRGWYSGFVCLVSNLQQQGEKIKIRPATPGPKKFPTSTRVQFKWEFGQEYFNQSIITWPMIPSFSSSGKSAGTMPDVSMLLMSSRNPGNGINQLHILTNKEQIENFDDELKSTSIQLSLRECS